VKSYFLLYPSFGGVFKDGSREEAINMAGKEYKQLSCRDAGADCDFLVRAETKEEVMAVAAGHGARVHGMKEVTPEMKNKMESIIKTVRV